MASVVEICGQWQDVRNGLLKEVELIPAEQFTFRAAPDTRSVLEVVQHIIESERALSSEMCRDNTNLGRGIPAIVAEFAGHVNNANTKDSLLSLLQTSFEETKAKVLDFGDANFAKMMTRFDGREQPKYLTLSLSVAHEMYHRGQLTVYQRLLGIEPALTQYFKKVMGSASS